MATKQIFLLMEPTFLSSPSFSPSISSSLSRVLLSSLPLIIKLFVPLSSSHLLKICHKLTCLTFLMKLNDTFLNWLPFPFVSLLTQSLLFFLFHEASYVSAVFCHYHRTHLCLPIKRLFIWSLSNCSYPSFRSQLPNFLPFKVFSSLSTFAAHLSL